MRMIKKICSVICAAVIALGGVNIVVTAQDTESQIKYNYKLSMESDSDFRMVYSYNGGTISTKKSYVSGKYGNAMQITYPGHEISDPSKRYNGFVMQFKSEPIELANESISMLDLMRDTKNISMWVHTPQTVDHGNGAAEHRVLEIAMEYSSTEGNKKYSKKFQLPNNGEWEYITIPTSAFKSGSVTMDQGIQSDIYTALNQMTIIFPYKDYFGANPTSDTLETPWEEPLKIDEILFDRSTDEVGETSWSFWSLLSYSLDGFINFSEVPLKLATWAGTFSFLISLVGIIFVIIRKLTIGGSVAGWASLVSIILFIGGIQLLALGIIGNYISKIFLETKKRPVYIVKEKG